MSWFLDFQNLSVVEPLLEQGGTCLWRTMRIFTFLLEEPLFGPKANNYYISNYSYCVFGLDVV